MRKQVSILLMAFVASTAFAHVDGARMLTCNGAGTIMPGFANPLMSGFDVDGFFAEFPHPDLDFVMQRMLLERSIPVRIGGRKLEFAKLRLELTVYDRSAHLKALTNDKSPRGSAGIKTFSFEVVAPDGSVSRIEGNEDEGTNLPYIEFMVSRDLKVLRSSEILSDLQRKDFFILICKLVQMDHFRNLLDFGVLVGPLKGAKNNREVFERQGFQEFFLEHVP